MFIVKRILCAFFTVLLLISCISTGIPDALATSRKEQSRAIAIVFDNSGSMYDAGDQAWCRATYAMEVFASMLNNGDIMQIYPMHPIKIKGKKYTTNKPFEITSSSQASLIRDIFTEDAAGTPIESVDSAIKGLKKLKAEKKYAIILTDGGTFSKKDYGLSSDRTKAELDKRIKANIGKNMTIMHLGIGSSACMPDTQQSEYFVKKKAVNTKDVLSTLTEMCNQIFGRDTLPKSKISGNTMNIDISMKKLIVFVQGKNISDVKLTGDSLGKLVSSQQTKYSTKGAGDYKSVPDTSLQGMMVTYTDCGSGKYAIKHKGKATSVNVYYEPDADLDFIFTDADGNTVDPNALYEGEYKVSFGMKDARTGKLISSDLLGKPHYKGAYYTNDKKTSFTHDGNNGSVPVSLKMDDTFDADLTVTYLSGYTISKDSSDFGWPAGGIQVAARPAGKLKLEITGGDDSYSLQDLEKGTPFTAKIYYKGKQITGDNLKKVDLRWEPDTSNAEIKKEFADDHYDLVLCYKNPDKPEDTVCGKCTVSIYAYYSAPGSSEAQAQCPVTYNIKDDFAPLKLQMTVPQSYIVIDELDKSQSIVVTPQINGKALSPEDFSNVRFDVDCNGIKHKVTANKEDSTFSIQLLPTANIAPDKYPVSVNAEYTDHIGRKTKAEETAVVEISNMPLWLRWLLIILGVLAAILIIWAISRIRVLPKKMHTTRNVSNMNFDGDDVTRSTNFLAEIKNKGAKIQSQYAGKKFGLTMSVDPGRESYLYKPHKRRSAVVKVASVKKFGSAKIQEAMIGSTKYIADENTGKLVPALQNQKPFLLTDGTRVKYSGTIQDAGIEKDFEVTSTLVFKKK